MDTLKRITATLEEDLAGKMDDLKRKNKEIENMKNAYEAKINGM
jgi:hypothetical protein